MKARIPLLVLLATLTTTIASAEVPNPGPWLDLIGGGHAVGPTQTIQVKDPEGNIQPWFGSLVNGTLLPASGEGFVRLNSPDTSWGAGMTISLIEKATAFYVKTYQPKNKIFVASIAQEGGGPYGPHKSHQNGLDADILFMEQTKYGTVLDEQGQVTDKFDPQKNWNFWKLLMTQNLVLDGKLQSAVYMIFVAPVIKDFMCQWAEKQNLLQDPESIEILRRLRRTAGHDTHFHLRLRCSPYYVACYQQGEIAAGSGCAEADKAAD